MYNICHITHITSHHSVSNIFPETAGWAALAKAVALILHALLIILKVDLFLAALTH